MALETKIPPKSIYRVGRGADAWQAPDWSWASLDGTFGNRFDDPDATYVNKVPSLACRAGKPVCREPLNAEWLSFAKALLE